ncbi:phenylalanine--tRNA ligase subunit beta [Jatrophihabitans sp. YIM 134969]
MPGGGVVKVPRSWLGEHVDVPAGLSTTGLGDALVRVGFEVEEVELAADRITGPVVLGRVLEIEELTQFKKPIRYCQVDVGNAEPRGIVCGARNFAVGDLVVVSLPGAVLPGGFAIAARKTYDHVSDGMICSARELGLGDDHDGIMVLPAETGAPGDDALPMLGLDDDVLHLAVTPDRGYALSIRGLARETSTALDVAFRDPAEVDVPPVGDGFPVTVDAVDGCDRFSALEVTGLDPAAASPTWMTRRLRQAGMRPISLAVDVTNYVMLELGQPLHAFDRATVKGGLGVRRATAGETLRTLDGADRTLAASDLVVTDDDGPVALAGVMGGERTEISASTTDIVLEAAHWTPADIARTVRRHRLPSEAAKRFERGVDPEVAGPALARAASLLAEFGGATVAGVLTVVGEPTLPAAVTARPGRLAALAGVEWSAATITRRLEQVGATVADSNGELTVTPPSWRPDLRDEADLTEEVARLEGYDSIPSRLPTPPAGVGLTASQRLRRDVTRAVAASGYLEVVASPFMSAASLDAFDLAAADPRRRTVELANPLADTDPLMRTTLLPGLLAALVRNVGRGQRDVALFATGLVFLARPDAVPGPRLATGSRPSDADLAALDASLPEQPRHLAAVLTGERDPRGWWGPGRPADWADAVEVARTVAAAARADLTVAAGHVAPWHPGRCAELRVAVDGVGERVVGHAGELHPRVVAALGLPARTCAVELDLDAFAPPAPVQAPVVAPYPPALADIALVVADRVAEADVAAAVRAGAGDLLESVRLFDVYTGANLGEGRKSLAYALRWRAPDRTLTSDEVSAFRQAAVDRAQADVGAVLRT